MKKNLRTAGCASMRITRPEAYDRLQSSCSYITRPEAYDRPQSYCSHEVSASLHQSMSDLECGVLLTAVFYVHNYNYHNLWGLSNAKC